MVCREGNVNVTGDGKHDVLFVNGSAGSGEERIVVVEPGEPLTLEMTAPKSREVAPFALYFFRGAPAGTTVRDLPFSLGMSCMPVPLMGTGAAELVAIANNIGRPDLLGIPTVESFPAPSVVLTRGEASRRETSFFVQGLILDRESNSGRAAVTNGILVELR